MLTRHCVPGYIQSRLAALEGEAPGGWPHICQMRSDVGHPATFATTLCSSYNGGCRTKEVTLLSVPELRRLVLRYCDTAQALLAFNFRFNDENRRILNDIRAEVPLATAKRLRDFRDELRENVARFAKEFGCMEDPARFAEWFKKISISPQFGTACLPKWFIDRNCFSNFGGDRASVDALLAPHAMIWLDFDAHNVVGQFDYVLPEAALYEDMAVAYNNAVRTEQATPQPTNDREAAKTHTFFMRQSVLCAFYFVEAYLNGVAFDYCYRNPTLPSSVTDVLLEWNSKRNAEQWVNFRAKLLQYPKLILGVQHPPLTETNCDALRLLLEAREVRDALVHQSPKLTATGPRPVDVRVPKVAALMHLRMPDATAVVDTAIALVRRLNDVLGKNGLRLDWLYDRSAEALFPKETFY